MNDEEKRTIDLEFPSAFWKQFESDANDNASLIPDVLESLICFGMLAGHRYGHYDGYGCIAWVPAEEELPDAGVEVLVSCENGEIELAFMAIGKWWLCEGCPLESRVVHWTEIVKPPSKS